MLTKIDKPNNQLNIPRYVNPHMDYLDECISIRQVPLETLQGGYAIQDPVVTKALQSYVEERNSWADFFVANGKHSIQDEYKETFLNWIRSSQLNNIRGLDNFGWTTITNGTSEAFQMFMMRHNNRRFKFVKGDFIIHKVASNVMELDWEWLREPSDLDPGDAVIISLPFSDTGSPHNELHAILESACNNDVPVLIDMAYFGMCVNLDVDLNYRCIEEVTFSLGKTFPIIGARAGIRLQRQNVDDPVLFANQNGIVNNFACKIGNFCMLNYSPDYIPLKYYDAYYSLCVHNDIQITNCVVFGLSANQKYSEINRGNKQTRLCLSKYVLENYEQLEK